MNVTYEFNANKCWYKDNCSQKGTESCNYMCQRYTDLFYQTKYALLNDSQCYPPKLIVPECDKQEYETLINIRSDIVNFVKSGKNLVIISENTGNGKTAWSLKLLMQYLSKTRFIDEKPYALFVPCTRFLVHQKNSMNNITSEFFVHITKNVETVPLVVWDDLVVENMTRYDSSVLYAYIDARISANKSNIFTINGKESDIAYALGDKLYSRVFRTSTVVEFANKDMRGIAQQ